MARIKKIEVVPGTKLQVAKVGKFQGYTNTRFHLSPVSNKCPVPDRIKQGICDGHPLEENVGIPLPIQSDHTTYCCPNGILRALYFPIGTSFEVLSKVKKHPGDRSPTVKLRLAKNAQAFAHPLEPRPNLGVLQPGVVGFAYWCNVWTMC